jgi:hypothetical protein
MIPAIPAFLVLVMAGVVALARFAGPLRLLVIAGLVGWLLIHELHYDFRHRNYTRAIGVEAIAEVAARQPAGSVLFGSTGTSGALFSSFDYGHPANLLDHCIALRIPSLSYVDDDSCERAVGFLRGSRRSHSAVWLFYAAAPGEVRAGRGALARVAGARVQEVAGAYFVVRPRRPLPPRSLIALGVRVRLAWRRAVPLNRRVNELLQADRQLLRRPPVCTPYGELGDPGISPHWPPVKTRHQ